MFTNIIQEANINTRDKKNFEINFNKKQKNQCYTEVSQKCSVIFRSTKWKCTNEV